MAPIGSKNRVRILDPELGKTIDERRANHPGEVVLGVMPEACGLKRMRQGTDDAAL